MIYALLVTQNIMGRTFFPRSPCQERCFFVFFNYYLLFELHSMPYVHLFNKKRIQILTLRTKHSASSLCLANINGCKGMKVLPPRGEGAVPRSAGQSHLFRPEIIIKETIRERERGTRKTMVTITFNKAIQI